MYSAFYKRKWHAFCFFNILLFKVCSSQVGADKINYSTTGGSAGYSEFSQMFQQQVEIVS